MVARASDSDADGLPDFSKECEEQASSDGEQDTVGDAVGNSKPPSARLFRMRHAACCCDCLLSGCESSKIHFSDWHQGHLWHACSACDSMSHVHEVADY